MHPLDDGGGSGSCARGCGAPCFRVRHACGAGAGAQTAPPDLPPVHPIVHPSTGVLTRQPTRSYTRPQARSPAGPLDRSPVHRHARPSAYPPVHPLGRRFPGRRQSFCRAARLFVRAPPPGGRLRGFVSLIFKLGVGGQSSSRWDCRRHTPRHHQRRRRRHRPIADTPFARARCMHVRTPIRTNLTYTCDVYVHIHTRTCVCTYRANTVNGHCPLTLLHFLYEHPILPLPPPIRRPLSLRSL